MAQMNIMKKGNKTLEEYNRKEGQNVKRENIAACKDY
jgi:hypothetical protein